MRIFNPAQSNVIATSDPLAIQAAEAAVAGVLGQVSDSGHLHPIDLSDFLSMESEQLTEATTTSTSPVSLLTLSGLAIPAATPFLIVGSARKSAGAANDAHLGLQVNATVVSEAAVSTSTGVWHSSTADSAQDGTFVIYVGPRVTGYEQGATSFSSHFQAGRITDASDDADIPAVEITSIVIRGLTDNALNTLAVDEVRIYLLPTS